MPSLAARRFVAFAGHAPGLWLVFREPVPRALWGWNIALLAATALATAAVALTVEGTARWPAAIGTWTIGHVVWGVILAARLPAQPPAR